MSVVSSSQQNFVPQNSPTQARASRWLDWLEAMAVAALVLHPYSAWAGALLLALLYTPLRRGVSGEVWLERFLSRQGYLYLWGTVFGLIALRHLFASDTSHMLQTILQGVLVILASLLLQAKRRTAVVGLLIALLAMAALSVGERLLLARSWQVSEEEVHLEPTLFTGIDTVADLRTSRLWRIPADGKTFNLSFAARFAGGAQDWNWEPVPEEVKVDYIDSEFPGADFTRIDFTQTENDPHALRIYAVPEGVAGGKYKLTLQLRTVQPVSESDAAGRVYLFAGANTFFSRGVRLGPAWQTVTLEWYPGQDAVPVDAEVLAKSKELSVVLNDFNEFLLDVRKVSLTRWDGAAWQSLGASSSTGAKLELGRFAHDASQTFRFLPTIEWQAGLTVGVPFTNRNIVLTGGTAWQDYTITGDVPKLTKDIDTSVQNVMYALLRLEPRLKLQTRNVKLSVDGKAVQPMTRVTRQTLWFGQPNLFGHTLAMALAVFVLFCPVPWRMLNQSQNNNLTTKKTRFFIPWQLLLGCLVGLLAISLTGSRAAYIATVFAIFATAWLRVPRAKRWTVLLAGGIFVVLAIVFRSQLGRFQLFGVDAKTGRTIIWQTAAGAFKKFPWLGVGDGLGVDELGNYQRGFGEFWQTTHPTSKEIVTHAHNMWLSLASRYGVFGALASLGLTVGLPWLAWFLARWRGLILVIALFLLNTFDDTLFHTTTLLILALGLNVASVSVMGIHAETVNDA